MFATPAPAAPTLSTSSSQASPSSPTRASRLRGLHYLRSYTHNHLHSHSSSSALNSSLTLPPVTRSQSQPGESSFSPATLAEPPSIAVRLTTHEAQAPSLSTITQQTAAAGSTSGWLPSIGLRSSTSRTSTHAESSPTVTVAATATGASVALPSDTASPIPDPPMRPMTRNRAETAVGAPAAIPAAAPHTRTASQAVRTISAPDVHIHEPSQGKSHTLPTIKFTPHQDARSSRPSLVFPTISRTLPSQSTIIRVGRYSERDSTAGYANEPPPGTPSGAPVGFKSKVVSRRHCEFWCSSGQWYIKDVGSSSGTFLNHIRLSQPGVESKPYVVSDGDVVQLGIDFRGGEEMIFRCVKIRVEVNRGWQKGLNNFNKSTHKRLKNLAKSKPKADGDNTSLHTSECSICLMSIAPCQSLFVAPCSHVWHYKCIRPILNGSTWPNFLCPNCRAVADLEADVDEEEVDWSEDDDAAGESEIKKAIEQSLADSKGEVANGARIEDEGGPVGSSDATNAGDRERAPENTINPDATAGATNAKSIPRINSDLTDGRVASYGQGVRDAREDTSRTPRTQRSFVTSRPGGRQQQQSRQNPDSALDADLAHLVSNMGLIAPSRTPPPPPPINTKADQARQVSNNSLPVPISGTASRSSHESSRQGSRQPSRARSNNSDGRAPPVTSPVSLAAVDNDTTMQTDFSDEDAAADAGIGVGFGVPGARPVFNRRNPPSGHSPASMTSEGRESDQLEVRGAEIGDPDFPMTPRNDAGPFILDGSGGRS